MRLSEKVMKLYQPLKRFSEPFQDRVNSMDFSPDGQTLIICSDDDSIHIFDAVSGVYVHI